MRSETLRVYNFSVADFHTYYVAAGEAAVLVHNTPPAACRFTSAATSPKKTSHTVWKTNDESIRVDVENPSPGEAGTAAFHVQFKGRGADPGKYYYNPSDGTWVREDGVVLSKKVAKQIPREAVNKALRFMGISQ
jgi:hypothetical protein